MFACVPHLRQRDYRLKVNVHIGRSLLFIASIIGLGFRFAGRRRLKHHCSSIGPGEIRVYLNIKKKQNWNKKRFIWIISSKKNILKN